MISPRFALLRRWALSFGALACIVLAYKQWLHVNPTTVALTLLLLVLLLAARWGLRYAVAVSIAAAFCFNFFFLPPVGTFTIADTQNWIALVAFFATALLASQLSNRIQQEARTADARRRELEVLYRLSRELLQIGNVAEIIESIPRGIAGVVSASRVVLYLSEGELFYCSDGAVLTDSIVLRLKRAMHLPGGTSDSSGKENTVPLRVGVRPRGALTIDGVELSGETLEATGGLVSIAIDRAQALAGAARSEAAKESERLRASLLDSVTHELRSPLTAIKASASTLLSDSTLGELDRRDLLTVIDEESDRLNHLIGQAVQMAQLSAQEIRMNLCSTSVAEMIRRACKDSEGMLSSHPVSTEIPGDLPQVCADPLWIERVLSNLLGNAAKYSADGKPIAIGATRQGEWVAIHISDQGEGIDVEEQTLIFEKFYRGRAHKQRVPGSGMGLAICRAILRAHKGTITVMSEPGQGSVFTFTLPVADPMP